MEVFIAHKANIQLSTRPDIAFDYRPVCVWRDYQQAPYEIGFYEGIEGAQQQA